MDEDTTEGWLLNISAESLEEMSFTAREYQLAIRDAVLGQNSIVFLPTGAGKTFISILLMKDFSENLDKDIAVGGQRIIFIAPKVDLVKQQAEYITVQTNYKTRVYVGSMNVDIWPPLTWKKSFNDHMVHTMSAQILYDCLTKKYIEMKDISLLIVDECHHATKKHSMNKIFSEFYDPKVNLNTTRVVGLTAALIKANTSDQQKLLTELENNMRSKLVRLDDKRQIKGFYADPDVTIKQVSNYIFPAGSKDIMENIEASISLFTQIATEYKLKYQDSLELPAEVSGHLLNCPESLVLNLKRAYMDIKHQFNNLGLYGCYISTLVHKVAVERLLYSGKVATVASYVIATIASMRRLQEKCIEILQRYLHDPSFNSLNKIHSPKMLELFDILREHLRREKTEDKYKVLGIIFVERAVTAKTIFHILQILRETDNDFGDIKPEFIFRDKAKHTSNEYFFNEAKTNDAIKRFNCGELNILVATNLLEEGIDISKCNMVIKFDIPKSLCSFIQSKGRAREKNSQFYVINEPIFDRVHFSQELVEYKRREDDLNRLQTNFDGQGENENENEEEFFETRIGTRISSQNSIPIVYRFCQSISPEWFDDSEPHWLVKKQDRQFICTVVLPLNSYLMKPIIGNKKNNKQNAKTSAALETIKALYRVGALDDNFNVEKKQFIQLNENKDLFPCWKNEVFQEDESPTGSTKRKRSYQKLVPPAIASCAPTENVTSYIHLIKFIPCGERPTEVRNGVFFDMYSDLNEEFALVTSTPWPKLCDFYIHLSLFDCQIHIESNYTNIIINQTQIKALRHFNMELFQKLLQLDKTYLVRSFTGGNDNYLIAPLVLKDGNYIINWDVANLNTDLSLDEYEPISNNMEDMRGKVIKPTYRKDFMHTPEYVVCEILHDETAEMPFTNDNRSVAYENYIDYFKQRYEVEIINTTQPLLAVKAISKTRQCITPRKRCVFSKVEKAKYKESIDPELFIPKYEEKFLGEICSLVIACKYISAPLWLKARTIPSILVKITRILNAEYLKNIISKDTGIGSIECVNIEKLIPDQYVDEISERENIVRSLGFGPPKLKGNLVNLFTEAQDIINRAPTDLDKNLFSLSSGEIRAFEAFAKIEAEENDIDINKMTNIQRRDNSISVIEIKLLSPNEENIKYGPHLCQIYSALTTLSSRDSVNMERFETLGDSYLKFASTLYLFSKYKYDEGILTSVKCKIVGNRNLYYCGVKRDICNIITSANMFINVKWKPPNLIIPPDLEEFLNEVKAESAILDEIIIPEIERITGDLSDTTMEDMANKIHGYGIMQVELEDAYYAYFFNRQVVSDKSIADCVEALLGVYVETVGPILASKLLTWFKILPKEIEHFIKIGKLDSGIAGLRNFDPKINVNKELNRHLIGVNDLEDQLNYQFKDRCLLLQAISHKSFSSNILTESYQRLEYLGDAVLDFLITAYIYEHGGQRTPGELTDLRSSLVNNITLATWVVRYGFYRHIKTTSKYFLTAMIPFIKYQAAHNHVCSEEHFLLKQDSDCNVVENIEVPKVLGDIFESLVAAVFLDTGKNLKKTWEVFYPLMKPEIDKFSAKIPKNPIRLVYELFFVENVEFQNPVVDVDGTVKVELIIHLNELKTISYIGKGKNKQEAKLAAAKAAVIEKTQIITENKAL